jgi:thiol-disulfide isomerase/thioredoxin
MRVLIAFAAVLLLYSCTPKTSEFKTGTWRGILHLQGKEVPFLFDVEKQGDNYRAFLRNDTERILLDEITVTGDTVNMVLHVFDASLKAKIDGDQLNGTFVKNYALDASIPFTATLGDSLLFPKAADASEDFTGKYQVTFYDTKDTIPSVGVFKQTGNILKGTFLTPTGDYRYLDGIVSGNEMKLSTYDGNHAFLFVATKAGDSLRGNYYSGKAHHETFVAVKNENAALPDLESLTFLKPGYEKLEFSFPDVNGSKVSPSDDRFKNKVLILQIFGTWCPNCMDETKSLTKWYGENKDRGVEILGLAYERKDDFEYAKGRVIKMKEKWNVPYDFVIAGVNDKEKASLTLPALNRVLAFPTTIFIGKDGKVKSIHTGFSGPSTGMFYEQFVQHFNETVNELLAEKSTSSIN